MPRRPVRPSVPATTPAPPKRALPGLPGPLDAAYYVPSVHPAGPGPWTAEPDKVAWTDDATGLACVIRRSPRGGHLCGHVAVSPGHPLHGVDHGALAGLFIHVHGGLGWSAACERHEPEDRSVCHVPPARGGPELRTGPAAHDDAWWFGFACDGPDDVVPNVRGPATERPDAGLRDPVYRDLAWVHAECGRLADQLAAIGEGRSALEAQAAPRPRPGAPS